MSLDGRAVLVTGGSSGLGAAVVDAVGSSGGVPLVVDLHPPEDGIDHRTVDLADTRQAEVAVHDLCATYPDLAGVVTAAGVDACGRLEHVEAKSWEHVVAVNLLGTAAVVRAALPTLREHHGRIVTVASTLGLRPLPDATAYCASKFGVVGFTRALAAELGDSVGVTLLVPGGMATPFFDGRDEQYRPPPDLHMNDPADVARTVLFALEQPPGCEIRELVVCPSTETSWP